MPAGLLYPDCSALASAGPARLSPLRRAELDKFGAACRTRPELRGMVQVLFDAMLPRGKTEFAQGNHSTFCCEENGFDPSQHEQIRADLKEGRIGLAQNRLARNVVIEDVRGTDVIQLTGLQTEPGRIGGPGTRALHSGQVAVVTLAAGAGSRWTQGAGVVKGTASLLQVGRQAPHIYRDASGEKPTHCAA